MSKLKEKYIPLAEGQPPVINQVQLVGKPRRRNLGKNIPPQIRVSRVVTSLDQTSGNINFHSIHQLPKHVIPSDLNHLPQNQVWDHLDKVNEGSPKFSTAKKRKTTTVLVDLDAQIIAQGGDPHYRQPKNKQGGWFNKP